MTDFAIVGGGIAGASAAAFLSQHGDVALFEMESSLAYHTTGRSAAMLVENYGSAGSRPLVKAARPFLENPPPGSVDGPLLTPRPVMWVAPHGEEGVLDEVAATGRANGAAGQLITPEEAIAEMPILDNKWLAAALFEPSGADIDVAALHQAFVRIARANGALISPSSKVTAIERAGARWRVSAGGKSMTVEGVVNAAGAWGDVVAAMAGIDPIGLQPYRRTAFMVPGSEATARGPMVVDVGERWYFRPDGVQFLCSLAEETPSEPTDARPRTEDVALAIERINAATTLSIRTVSSQWAGLRTFAPDRDLVIGEDPTAPGFYWLCGQGGIGIQTSPAYGALLAALVTDRPLPPGFDAAGVDPTLTDPGRFR